MTQIGLGQIRILSDCQGGHLITSHIYNMEQFHDMVDDLGALCYLKIKIQFKLQRSWFQRKVQ